MENIIVHMLSDKDKKTYDNIFFDINIDLNNEYWSIYIYTNYNATFEYIINSNTGKIVKKITYS